MMRRPEAWWLAVQVKFYTREGNWDLVGNNFPVSLPKLLHIMLVLCSTLYLSGSLLERGFAAFGCSAAAQC